MGGKKKKEKYEVPPPPTLSKQKKKKKNTGVTTHLHLNIQNTDSALVGYILHGFLRRSVAIGRELSVLDKGILGHEVQECLARHKMVVDTVDFILARRTGSVFCLFFFIFSFFSFFSLFIIICKHKKNYNTHR